MDTILSKRSKMNEALKEFYKDRPNEYSTGHSAQSLFTKGSHTFKEIVSRAAYVLKSRIENIDPDSQKVVRSYMSYVNNDEEANKKDFSEKVSNVFDYVFIDIDNLDKSKRPQKLDKNAPKKYLSLMENFSYYGSVEKDFSTIINPSEAGRIRFWRLINYFWSAYFSIIIPVLNLSTEYRTNSKYNENKYAYILNNLNKVVNYIYSEEFKKQIDKHTNSYYKILKKSFPNSNTVTTNYTPFLELYKFKKSIYLSGKLSQFEIPEELRIVDIEKSKEDIANKFIFPYLLTQAPIKPIIDCSQLQEYNEFITVLNETETLAIVGYNINSNDNHINTLLRNFLIKKPTNHIVFFEYIKKGERIDRNMTMECVAQKLKIFDNALKQQIIVFANDGDVNNLVEHLKQ